MSYFSNVVFEAARQFFPDSWKSLTRVNFSEDGFSADLCTETDDPYFAVRVNLKKETRFSIFGDRMVFVPEYQIWFPVWDAGDDSVGLHGCYELDVDNEPDMIVGSWACALKEIALWMIGIDMDNALADAGEYEYFLNYKAEEEV